MNKNYTSMFEFVQGEDGKLYVPRTKPSKTDAECDELDELSRVYADVIRERELSTPLSPAKIAEWLKDDPDSAQQFHDTMKSNKEELAELDVLDKAIVSKAKRHPTMSDGKKELVILVNKTAMTVGRRKFLEKSLKKGGRVELFLGARTVKKYDTLDKEKAREIPIDTFIDFNNAHNAECLWHSDSNPSMHYYEDENRVWCFSCNQGGDVIDVIQQLHDVDFVKALEILSEHAV
jgi:hypothetical protein